MSGWERGEPPLKNGLKITLSQRLSVYKILQASDFRVEEQVHVLLQKYIFLLLNLSFECKSQHMVCFWLAVALYKTLHQVLCWFDSKRGHKFPPHSLFNAAFLKRTPLGNMMQSKHIFWRRMHIACWVQKKDMHMLPVVAVWPNRMPLLPSEMKGFLPKQVWKYMSDILSFTAYKGEQQQLSVQAQLVLCVLGGHTLITVRWWTEPSRLEPFTRPRTD